jgi:hypothetical protein
MMKFNSLIVFILTAIAADAQVAGVITDFNDKPLGGVTVFINKTSVQTRSNEEGKFSLSGIPSGFVEIVLSLPGYTTLQSRMRVRDTVRSVLKLKLSKQKDTKKTPKVSENDKVKLVQLLLKKIADKTIQVNADQVSVSWKDSLVSSPKPLTLINETLGLSRSFIITAPTPIASLFSNPSYYTFEQLQDISTNINRTKATRDYYKGTLRNWLTSLIKGSEKANGFIMTSGTVKIDTSREYKRIEFSGPVTVVYEGVLASTVTPKRSVEIDKRGVLLDPGSLEVAGSMSATGEFAPLPDDYSPPTVDIEAYYYESLKRFYEKIHVQTDKPYYYPGETIWFKSFVNCFYRPWKDSLSRVMYVELINDQKKKVAEQTLEIRNGAASSNFRLPDSLSSGAYFIRAYTNLQRNYGEDKLYYREIPVVDLNTRVEEEKETGHDQNGNYRVVITPNKSEFGRREKAEVSIDVVDVQGRPVAAALGVSVYDATQVSFISTPSIKDDLKINRDDIPPIEQLQFTSERDLTISGSFTDRTGKPLEDKLSITQMQPQKIYYAESDRDGKFLLEGLKFYDSTDFYIRPLTPLFKDSKIKMQSRSHPMVYLPETLKKTLHTHEASTPQRILTEYEKPDSVTLLNTVEVRGEKWTEEMNPEYRVQRPYGKGDYVLKAKDLNLRYPNLILALQGRFPGLMVRQTSDGNWVVYVQRSITSSVLNPREVMVMVDNVVLGGTPEQTLMAINPSTVESIEVTTRQNVIYGSQGAFGVISIYTKNAPAEDESKKFDYKPIKLVGYKREERYKTPDYSMKDASSTLDSRSSIYWDAHAYTNAKGSANITFYTSDLTGPYRIVVEGVTAGGEPVEGSLVIKCIER